MKNPLLKICGEFSDIDRFIEAVAFWDQEYVKLDRSPYQSSFVQFVGEDFYVGQSIVKSKIFQLGGALPGFYAFGCETGDHHGSHIRSVDMSSGVAIGIRPGEEPAYSIPTSSSLITIALAAPIVQRTTKLPPRNSGDLVGTICPDSYHLTVQDLFKEILHYCDTAYQNGSYVDAQYVATVLSQNLIWKVRKNSHGNEPRERRFTAFRQMVTSSLLGQDFDFNQFLERQGVGRNSTRRHLNERIGLTPVQLANMLRIFKARKNLQSGAHSTVTSAAFDAGVVHLSRFASVYQHIYGETPSETLKRWT